MSRRWMLICLTAALLAVPSTAQKFLKDDPLGTDPDKLSIPQPTERPLSKTIDLLQKTFTDPVGGQAQAQNSNTLGEVPESSWFSNRMSARVMSNEELVRGPNRGDAPDLSKVTILGAKTEGVTPGFRVRDAKGNVYFLKFDPLYWPQMATSTEVVSTKFFHAFGYNVPENYLAYWVPNYDVREDADITLPNGQITKMEPKYIENVLKKVPRRPDGSIQLVASKLLPGSPLGPFDYQGVRVDDPNDVIVHEDRRELRALRIFCAWMNHNDSDAVNSLDMYHTGEDGSKYVMHYMIDFGTTLGSGATLPHARRVGNEYYIDLGPTLKAAATLGIWDRPWRGIDYKEYRSVGRFESDYFQPQLWKPDYPNPAFDRMTPQDALWATRTVMRFSDEGVRAIVAAGEYTDQEAQRHVADTLIARRNKIIHYYLAQINPLDGFAVNGNRLSFTNLGVEAGLASSCRYNQSWFRFDNASSSTTPLSQAAAVTSPVVEIPGDPAEYLMVRISSECAGQPKWASNVDVYLRGAGTRTVVGIDRATPAP